SVTGSVLHPIKLYTSTKAMLRYFTLSFIKSKLKYSYKCTFYTIFFFDGAEEFYFLFQYNK
ncbi:MAG TPA: hypothetical protein VIN08_00270, partial [Ohtaekwangia sp.]|uniref:hypothetical protein n=1 Tax=Ohtaekwangia sp. TaxID=2066019 RepID=UPI002F93E1D6